MSFLTKRPGRKASVAGAVVLAAGILIGYAGGGIAGDGIPANKATAAASKRVVAGPNQTVEILTATMKTSKPTDLILQLTMECSIFTALKTSNDNASATATGTVKAWITIDGAVVPIESISQPPQDPPPPGIAPLPGPDDPDAPHDGATMCNRTYHRTVTDDENNTPPDGIDTEDDYIQTKSAHGFNWLRQNAGSGKHVIKVWAILDQSEVGDATATVEIGNRTLIIEPTKMANDAVIAENGTS